MAALRVTASLRLQDKIEPTTSFCWGQESDFKFECRLLCCKCSYCHRVATKERRKFPLLSNVHKNKICERGFLCRSVEFCKSCHNSPPFVMDLPVGERLHKCWEKWEAVGSSPKVVTTLREGYTLPFRFRPNLTRSPTVVSNYHNPAKQANLLEALYQLVNKFAEFPLLLQPAIFGTQTQQPVETYPGSKQLEYISKHSRSKWRPQRQYGPPYK